MTGNDDPIDALRHSQGERRRLVDEAVIHAPSPRLVPTEGVRRRSAEPVGHEAVGIAAPVAGAGSAGSTLDGQPIRGRKTRVGLPQGDFHRPPSRSAFLLLLALFVLGLLLQASVVFA